MQIQYPACETNVTLGRIGGFSIPYLGYIEATVLNPQIKDYDECVPMLVLKSSLPFSLRVLTQLFTTVLDRAMAKIMVEELTYASSMWWQAFMNTVVMAGASGPIESRGQGAPLIDAPLVTMKPTVIPLWVHKSEGIGAVTTCWQLLGSGNCRTYCQSSGNVGRGNGY